MKVRGPKTLTKSGFIFIKASGFDFEEGLDFWIKRGLEFNRLLTQE